MEDNEGNKVTGIWQIVRLKELIHKWQSTTLGPKRNNLRSEQTHGGISPAISKRLRSFNSCCDSDEDGGQSPEPPHDVPKGYLAVYVGPELRRFIIPTSYLTDPVFKVLLEKVEEEFGFNHSGGLTIPCEIETFKYLLKVMETHQNDQPDQDGDTAGTSLAIEE
ncbi:Auxin-induced protein like [Actinidia chinensis var. chinensis]|uniref:Auxin-induced protein like n=1 Tax=Actinidia chinensis var. chinensis TaxID=1590841 RepID=A0A2R6Q5A5_ACTCC|nr:Auxin-induced protein like [Actinidia chinensis var. chinensis]